MRVDVERAVLEISFWIGRLKVQRRRDLAALHGEHRLHQTGDACRLVQMSNVRLEGAQGAGGRSIAGSEDPGQGLDLDGVADSRSGSVRFDILHRVGFDAAHRHRLGDDTRLPRDTGCRIPCLVGAVIVDGRTKDHRADGVAISQRIFEATQYDESDTVAAHRACRLGVEGSAVAVGRGDCVLLVHIALVLRQLYRGTTGQRHIALVIEQGLAGHVNGDERGRAGRVYVDAGAFEIQPVRHTGGEIVAAVPNQILQVADRWREVGIAEQMKQQIRAPATTRIDADPTVEALRHVPRIFQGMPGTLKEETMLGVGHLRFTCRHPEKGSVEELDVVEIAIGRHKVRVAQQCLGHARRSQFLGREETYPLNTPLKKLPELLNVRGAGETSCHADDRDAVFGVTHITSTPSSPSCSKTQCGSIRHLAAIVVLLLLARQMHSQ